ncbi:MAG: hypothetical protein LRY40_06545 [Shewanella fodinae]|nr:hypothetical protein [Shewanella fodinae]
MVSLEYVELSAKALSDKINVSDADAQAYYDEHKQSTKRSKNVWRLTS